ncbi:MAG: hypothetical protein AAFV95_12770 [Bacteroidota bacterium]
MKRKYTTPFPLLLCLFVLVWTTACEKSREQVISTHSELIDTLVNRELRLVGPRLDSICTAEYEERLQNATDSIVKIRKEKIEKLLGQ